MKHHRPHAFIREMHRQLDVRMEQVIARAGAVLPCRAGCAACCSEPVYAAPVEAAQIADAVRAMEPKLRARIEKAIGAAVTTLAQSTLWGLEQPRVGPYRCLEIVCPLLDESTRRCRVYDLRPMACRMHLARKPAEPFCNDPERRPEQQFVATHFYVTDIVKPVIATGRAEYDHLIVLLAGELLGDTRRSGAARRYVISSER